MKQTILKNVIQTACAVAFLLICHLFAYLIAGNELLVPSLFDCLKEMGALFTSGAFWTGLLWSFLRSMIAFMISFLFALIFAVISYMVPALENVVAPSVSALRSLPVLAVLLILLSVLGAAEAPVAVAFLSLFPMLYTGILAALLGIDKQVIAISRVHGASALTRIFRIYLPLSSPYILRESGAALSFSLKLVVSAEVLANTAKSLGGMMQEAKIYAEIPQLFALVGVTFALGLLLELSVSLLASAAEKRIK